MQIKECLAFSVEVKTTNALKDAFCDTDDHYHNCDYGKIIVVTDDPKLIIDWLGDGLIAMERLQLGYAYVLLSKG